MQPSTFYHIYNHANGSDNLFREQENYRFFLEKWAKYVAPVAETYAYCLMPNHFHFLVRVKEEEELKITFRLKDLTGFQNLSGPISKQFSNLFNSYSKAYNKIYDRRGSLFNRPFKTKEITSDQYLTHIIFYTHHNPVHGFTKQLEGWPHSSYHALVSQKPTKLNRQGVQDWFGSVTAIKEFHNQNIIGLPVLEDQFT